ncbi:hypothetical protein AMJ71_05175 [candidate division TA06 bacterium SM1_40]|uniref:Response regulatory domain-containing protein n=2 Tax=Bacteria division TA06 TaxID=1156500 RepID=A0A0S8JL22_UNCT6|nr:MAG: hypothetical protein AMJ82_03985 [candidate division TA06 bacterium SM23_40]KPL09907.1 MAG: hypothetical protein AMJ71_05175 [candidate division TA06 bacterium SM1_40]
MENQARILIVDDDADFVAATRKILEANGYEVDSSYTTHEAKKKIRAHRPDLILMDVMMERMNDGFVLCTELKNDDRYKDIPVIVLTSVTEKTGLKFSPEKDGEYLEAEALLDKPVEPAELLRRIRELSS